MATWAEKNVELDQTNQQLGLFSKAAIVLFWRQNHQVCVLIKLDLDVFSRAQLYHVCSESYAC